MINKSTAVIAYYLGQFHSIPENDQFWGEGFTEWHNVARARALFPGHQQPQLPGRFGFYDLRNPATVRAQIQYAEAIGINAFCYWHYWFQGRRVLNEVLDLMIAQSGSSVKFMLGWANESWTGIWHGARDRILINQTYGDDEVTRHGQLLSEYISSGRYLKIDGKSPFLIYKPRQIPDAVRYLGKLRIAVQNSGGGELYIIGNWGPGLSEQVPDPQRLGLDAVAINPVAAFPRSRIAHYAYLAFWRGMRSLRLGPELRTYQSLAHTLLRAKHAVKGRAHATIVTGWDNTPRSGRRGLALTGYNEKTFFDACRFALRLEAENKPAMLFVKSWNEWAEGNVIEPKFKETWEAGLVLKRALAGG